MDIIAHRGASRKAPENTLASITEAWRSGADGIEVDVHLTLDHQLAVIHDPDTARTGDKTLTVSKTSLKDLKRVDVGRWKSPQYAGERIPSLREVADATPANKWLLVEIKEGDPVALARALCAMEQKQVINPDRTWYMSFLPEVLDALQKSESACPLMLLLDESQQEFLDTLIKQPESCKYNALGLSSRIGLTKDQAIVLTDNGITLSVWVENEPSKKGKWQQLGFAFLTTDTPDIFVTH